MKNVKKNLSLLIIGFFIAISAISLIIIISISKYINNNFYSFNCNKIQDWRKGWKCELRTLNYDKLSELNNKFERECESQDGSYGYNYSDLYFTRIISMVVSCVMPLPDAGKPCLDGSDCSENVCEIDENYLAENYSKDELIKLLGNKSYVEVDCVGQCQGKCKRFPGVRCGKLRFEITDNKIKIHKLGCPTP